MARSFLIGLGALLALACSRRPGTPRFSSPDSSRVQTLGALPAPGADSAAAGEHGQWPLPAHDYANTRYSGLAQITTANAGNLRVACCDLVNRGASYADGKIYYNTLDAQTVAVDAETGKEAWRTRVGDFNK